MNKATKKAKEVKKKVDQHVTMELTKTRQILGRFSKVEKHIEKRRTTFSELFFDLAVVFIFSLLAAKMMGSIGQAVVQVQADAKGVLGLPQEMIKTNAGVGFFFWMAHFMALGFTGYQFSNYTKYHGIDNVGNNLLTLCLIMTLVLQGAGIYFTNEFLDHFSLIISFIVARIIFAIAQFIAIFNSPKVDISKELMIKTKRQMYITVFTIIGILAYIICYQTGCIDSDIRKNAGGNLVIHDPGKKEIFITCILMAHMFIRFFGKIIGGKHLSDKTYRIVFHTKERHHLFIIIALGELIVVTLTSSFINNQNPTVNYETILYLFMTPFIGIAIGYVYKTVFYKATPTHGKKNYYFYITTHVFLVLGILVFLGSLKSHMQADAFLKTNPMHELRAPMNEVSRTFYSLGVVTGFGMIVLSMTIYAVFAKFQQKRWGQVVKGLVPLLIAKAALVVIGFIVESVLFGLDIKVHFSTVMYTTFCIEAVFAMLMIWKSQKTILNLFDTVEHFDSYSAKLDH